jgi:hypothetical protein
MEGQEHDHSKVAAIARINDQFRKNLYEVVFTRGIDTLANNAELLQAIILYDTFTADNDPYGEHDFGSLTWDGHDIFWKIDYYDQTLSRYEDPLSKQCRRIMTIMLESEY